MPLSHIPNLWLSTGVFPDKQTAIRKCGSPNELVNRRPISVPSIFAKIFELNINKRLIGFQSANNIIVNQQFGFRINKLPETAHLEIKEQILEIKEKTNTGYIS